VQECPATPCIAPGLGITSQNSEEERNNAEKTVLRGSENKVVTPVPGAFKPHFLLKTPLLGPYALPTFLTKKDRLGGPVWGLGEN